MLFTAIWTTSQYINESKLTSNVIFCALGVNNLISKWNAADPLNCWIKPGIISKWIEAPLLFKTSISDASSLFTLCLANAEIGSSSLWLVFSIRTKSYIWRIYIPLVINIVASLASLSVSSTISVTFLIFTFKYSILFWFEVHLIWCWSARRCELKNCHFQ